MMKKITIAAFCLVLTSCVSSFAIMNVIDWRANAESIKQHTAQVRQWKGQADQWRQTLSHFTNQQQTMKDQLASFTGIRSIEDLESQIDSLMYDMDGIERHKSMFNDMLGSPDPEINGEANAILGKYQMFDVCQKKGSRRLDNICKEEVLNKAGTLETGDKIKKKMKRKMREVQVLSRKASMSTDIKESQDIANAISLKQSEINQLQHQWQTAVDEANLREKLIEQKKIQAFNEQQRNAPIPQFDINKFK